MTPAHGKTGPPHSCVPPPGSGSPSTAESLVKGQHVVITGALKQRSRQTDEGETRHGYEVDITELGASLRSAIVNKARRTSIPQSRDAAVNSERAGKTRPPF